MHGFENYLLYRKTNLPRSVSAGFIINLAGTMAAFGIAFALFSFFQPDSCFALRVPDVHTDVSSFLRDALLSQRGSFISLLILFASCFTVSAKTVMFMLCLWRGASLGCIASLLNSGVFICTSSSVSAALLMYFAAAVLFILLVSFTSVYSDCILCAFCSGEKGFFKELIWEFSICFLTLSGGVLSAGMLSSVIM